MKEIFKNPPLVDDVVRFHNQRGGKKKINGKEYYHRTLPYYSRQSFWKKVYHAWLVLKGKAVAMQYIQDRKNGSDKIK